MVRKSDPNILVFDSGFGGLSVLAALKATLPYANYLFLADDARFPYGDLRDDELIEGLIELIGKTCEQYQPDLLVVACNTASTVALSALRERFSFPIVGIVPAIKPAAHATRSGHFAVVATPGTIRRSYTRDLIRDYANGCVVDLVACNRLARLAEDYLLEGTRKEDAVFAEIKSVFDGDQNDDVDVIVLGCTHYPLLLPILQSVAPRPVLWIDPAHAVARRVMHLLEQEWQDCIVGFQPDQFVEGQRIVFEATLGNTDRLSRAWASLCEKGVQLNAICEANAEFTPESADSI
nr:glutamate racemase [uncultured Cohaesibacter sp.]